MKTCNKCDLEKDNSEFSKKSRSKDGLSLTCKLCSRETSKQYYLNNSNVYIKKQKERRKQISLQVQKEKDKPCKDCGQSYPHYVMDFDHLRDKKFNISAKIHNFGILQILEEIKKCDVVCSNCHRIRTYKRRMKNFSIVATVLTGGDSL